jgi:hypothetical protein
VVGLDRVDAEYEDVRGLELIKLLEVEVSSWGLGNLLTFGLAQIFLTLLLEILLTNLDQLAHQRKIFVEELILHIPELPLHNALWQILDEQLYNENADVFRLVIILRILFILGLTFGAPFVHDLVAEGLEIGLEALPDFFRFASQQSLDKYVLKFLELEDLLELCFWVPQDAWQEQIKAILHELRHGLLVAFLLLVRVQMTLLSRLDLSLVIEVFENAYGCPDDFQKLPDEGSKVHNVGQNILGYAVLAHLLYELREVIDLCLNALLLIKFVLGTKACTAWAILGLSEPYGIVRRERVGKLRGVYARVSLFVTVRLVDTLATRRVLLSIARRRACRRIRLLLERARA